MLITLTFPFHRPDFQHPQFSLPDLLSAPQSEAESSPNELLPSSHRCQNVGLIATSDGDLHGLAATQGIRQSIEGGLFPRVRPWSRSAYSEWLLL